MQPTKDFDRYKFLKEPIIKPKKLTFDEWWHQNNDDTYYYERDRKIWNAAQENK